MLRYRQQFVGYLTRRYFRFYHMALLALSMALFMAFPFMFGPCFCICQLRLGHSGSRVVAWTSPARKATMQAYSAGSMVVSQSGNFCKRKWRKEFRCWEKKCITFRVRSRKFYSENDFLRKNNALRDADVRAIQEISRSVEILGSKAARKESVEEHQRPLLCFPGG